MNSKNREKNQILIYQKQLLNWGFVPSGLPHLGVLVEKTRVSLQPSLAPRTMHLGEKPRTATQNRLGSCKGQAFGAQAVRVLHVHGLGYCLLGLPLALPLCLVFRCKVGPAGPCCVGLLGAFVVWMCSAGVGVKLVFGRGSWLAKIRLVREVDAKSSGSTEPDHTK